MLTFERLPRFNRDHRKLDDAQKRQFREALALFIAGVRDQRFDPRLRVKGVEGARGVYEMTWAADGRATWQYGQEQRPGEPHVIWRRIGTHDVFDRP